ncbi:MAG: hypothetical protein [Cressdnaviricota sp.]|nr:MAG: hypothetical protein [Cressdnaviricota sp.]
METIRQPFYILCLIHAKLKLIVSIHWKPFKSSTAGLVQLSTLITLTHTFSFTQTSNLFTNTNVPLLISSTWFTICRRHTSFRHRNIILT